MTQLLQRAKMTVVSAPGTGPFTLGVAYTDGVTFANAGVVNNMSIIYAAYDGTIFEQGQGIYTNTSGLVLTRQTIALSSNNNQKVNFSANVIVYAIAVPDTAIVAVNAALLRANLTFDPTIAGLRITADLTNGVVANRLSFQSAILNGDTYVTALPAGTSHISAFSAESDPLTTNGWAAQLSIRGLAGEARLESFSRGTAGAGYITFFAGAAERARVTNAGLAVTGALSTTGAATLGATLAVTGALTSGGALTASTTAHVVGAATLDSTLAVTGRATLTGGLTIGAGTQFIAPILLTIGFLLSTPVQGAVEWNGSNLFYTDGSARRTVAAQDWVTAQISGAAPGVQSPNTVFAGPTTAPNALPTYRSLIPADIPTLANSKITGSAASGANADITSLTGLTGTMVTSAQVAAQQTLGAGTIGTEARPFAVVRAGGSVTYLAVRETLFAFMDTTHGTGLTYDWNTFSITGNVSAVAATFTGALSANSIVSTTSITGASAVLTGVVQAGSATITGALSANALTSATSVTAGSGSFSGALSANSLSVTTSVSAASMTATGTVQGATVTSTGAVNANSLAVTAGITAASASLSGVLTALSLSAKNAPKAWVRFANDGTILRSFGIATVTHNTTGDYTITFSSPFADANYAFSLTAGYVASGATNLQVKSGVPPTAAAITVYALVGGGLADIGGTAVFWY